MSLKDDSQYYTFEYIASSTKGGEKILSYTAEELDEKGIDCEELVESIQAGEKFDGYFCAEQELLLNVVKKECHVKKILNYQKTT